MKQETQDMLYFHRDVNALLPYVPQDMLPDEFGGKAGTVRELHGNSNKSKNNLVR